MPGRASIVGAALTHVGNVREHNEDAFFFDAELGLFVVCDGMGGHAAGEVASEIAVRTVRERWSDDETNEVADVWLARGTAIAKHQLLGWLRDGVLAAHDAIVAEAKRDPTKGGMGTTLVAALVVGSELIFAHAGDSRAYIVRDNIAMQLTEDHTLLQRLLAAGIDVDQSGDGSRFRSMLTNALGIGDECKVSTFVVPLADGDRFMLCSDGISEYVEEAEVGEVLTTQASPARAAQKLVELALDRGGADNATAIVVRVLEAGESPVPAAQLRRDDLSISLCELWTEKVSPQQRLRALRIALPRDHAPGDKLPAHTLGDRVAWIVVEGEVEHEGEPLGPGAFIYPESLVAGSAVPDKDGLAVARTDVRAVALRSDDWRELCEEDAELGEVLLESLAQIIAANAPKLAPAAATPVASRTKADSAEVAIDRAIDGATMTPRPAELSRSTAEREALGRASTPTPFEEEAARAPVVAAPTPALMPAEVPRGPTEPRFEDGVRPDNVPQSQRRPPTAPEIEMVIEMDADEPDDAQRRSALESGGHAQFILTTDDGDAKVIETVVDTSAAVMSTTVEEPTRTKPVTADDAISISGTIEPELPRTRPGGERAKRAPED